MSNFYSTAYLLSRYYSAKGLFINVFGRNMDLKIDTVSSKMSTNAYKIYVLAYGTPTITDELVSVVPWKKFPV